MVVPEFPDWVTDVNDWSNEWRQETALRTLYTRIGGVLHRVKVTNYLIGEPVNQRFSVRLCRFAGDELRPQEDWEWDEIFVKYDLLYGQAVDLRERIAERALAYAVADVL